MQFLEKNENVFQESQHSAAFFSQLSLENVHCGESILPFIYAATFVFVYRNIHSQHWRYYITGHGSYQGGCYVGQETPPGHRTLPLSCGLGLA